MAGKEGFVNSIIGEGSTFSGSIELSGILRVDGDFSGEIKRADKVLISKSGRVRSSISARVVVIGGAVQGNIIAEDRITVLSTAIVMGSIKTPVLVVEEGVIFHGLCDAGYKVTSPLSITENNSDSLNNKANLFNVDWQKLGNK